MPLLLLLPGAAMAHDGGAHAAAQWGVLVPLALGAGACLAGAFRLRRVPRLRLLAATTGFGVLGAATLSPLAGAAEGSLLVHMVEHELMMVVAAPLLVLARPLGLCLPALPRAARRAVGLALGAPAWRWTWAMIAAPAAASAIQAVALWGWHVPALVQAALGSPVLHAAQHLSFLGAACLFWSAMLAPRAAGLGASVLHLFLASVQGGLLGALLLFAPRPWFPAQALGAPFGLSPMEDQQLAGLVMAGVACLAYPAAGLVLFARWVRGAGEGGRALVAG